MGKCDYLIDRPEIVGVRRYTVPDSEYVSRSCLREDGHEGPHLILILSGAYITWEKDLCPYGECEYCDDEDPTEACLAFGEVDTAEEVNKYLQDSTYK